MRLVTRGDLDGLVASVLLSSMEDIDGIELAHPQDITDNILEIGKGDVIAKLPYHPHCSMWFSHTAVTDSNVTPPRNFRGRHELAPSVSRVIYDYYNSSSLARYEPLVAGCDRLASASLTPEEVTHPEGIILLGFLIDPRTSFGNFKIFFKSLAMRLRHMEVEAVLMESDVAERVAFYRAEQEAFRNTLLRNSRVAGNLVITDFRSVVSIPVGNRFMIYNLFPQCNVSLRLMWGPKKKFVVATMGHSIFNTTCQTNIGDLASDFGGGGHPKAGSCPLDSETADAHIEQIIKALQE
jgi:hypothetical protein